MSLEELWKLFPIYLEEHDPSWEAWAHEEAEFLRRLLHDFNPVINHVGSTAIPLIKSKPIIDLIVELVRIADFKHVKGIMENEGYICMSESDGRMSFNRGYTPEGYAERVFHIHLRRVGDNDEILFRDYLNAHPDTAREYEALKLSLISRFRNNRDGYTSAKTDFVKSIMARIYKSGI